jgi:hypothetical protein
MVCSEGASETGRQEIALDRAQRIEPAVTQTSISPVGTAGGGWLAKAEPGEAVVAAKPNAESFKNSRRVEALAISSMFFDIEILRFQTHSHRVALRADHDHHACAFCNNSFIPVQLCREDSSGVPAPRQ